MSGAVVVTQTIWWGSNFLIVLLLIRALQAGLWGRYPVFYFYLSFVLAESLVRFAVYVAVPASYAEFYWNSRSLSIIVGCVVIWEIYAQALEGYAGVGRLARGMLLTAFVLVLARYIAGNLTGGVGTRYEHLALLERDLRTVQVFLLMGIVALVAYYGIPLGRNLLGMVLGYGIYVGVVVIDLAVQTYLWRLSETWWGYTQPVVYTLSLAIWCVTLWSYYPRPQPTRSVRLELDYQLFADQTADALGRMKNYFTRAVRS